MRELFDIIYIQKLIHIINNKYYIKDADLSNLFNKDISMIIKKDKILKYSCIRLNNHYYLDNECIIYIVNLLNTNKALIIYDKIMNAFNLILRYSSMYKVKVAQTL